MTRGVVLAAIALGVLAAGAWFGLRAPSTEPAAPVAAQATNPSSAPAPAVPAAPIVPATPAGRAAPMVQATIAPPLPPASPPANPPTSVPAPPVPPATALQPASAAQASAAPASQPPASAPAVLPPPPAASTATPSPLSAALPAVALAPPRFDIVRVNPQGSAVLAGRAAPGAEVVVRSNGREIGRVQADQQGQWVLAGAPPLPPGAHEITLEMRDAAGRQVAGDGAVLAMVAPPPAATAAAAPPSGSAPAPAPALPAPPLVVMTTPRGAPTLLQGPARAGGVVRLGLEVVDYDDAGEIRFAGTAPPGATVRIYIDDVPVGDAVAGADGRWTLVPLTRVAEGDHRLRLDQVDPNGRVAVRIEQPFQRAAVAAAVAGDQRVVVQPRQNLWRISRRAYGQGVRYTDIFAANRDQIRDPALIYPGQVFTIPAAPRAP